MRTYINFRHQVKENKTTCVKTTQEVLDNIEINKHLNTYIQLNQEEALVAAEESDKRFKAEIPRKIEGMIIGVKDNISVRNLNATCASKMLSNYQPVYDATIIKRIKSEGGIIIGKTNMDELAMGSSNETSYFGACPNPINNDYVTGGSSGGSASAVASELAHTALGSDTGGSIRQPASFCGTVGFKPTYGRISRYGLIAFASSLDHIGTFSANIDDTAILFDVMSGVDELDSTSANMPSPQTFEKINAPIPTKFKVGVLPNNILEKCSNDVLNIYSKQLEHLKTMGAEFHTLNFNFIDICVPTYIIITTSEASSNLARLDGIRYGHRTDSSQIENYIALSRAEGFGDEVTRRLLVGTYFLSDGNSKGYYQKAVKIREVIKQNISEEFQKVDLMFLPTTTTVAFKSNEKNADPVSMYLSDFFTTSANLAQIPAISLPVGKDEQGLPIGMQLQANKWEEEKLFQFSKVLMNLNNY